MQWIGLTGGIASGKSTVAKMLHEKGESIIDADQLAREVVKPGPLVEASGQPSALQQIAADFGPEILLANGELDRTALGKKIFDDPNARLRLEAILHPRIRELCRAQKKQLEKQGVTRAFYDVPLLFEKNMQKEFDQTVLVYCSPAQQLSRLMQRNGLTKKAAEARLHSQLPMQEKKKIASVIIDNSGDLEQLRVQVEKYLASLN